MTWLKLLLLLTLVVWVGGIIFFAMVLAPTAFRSLPSPHLAAAVVGPSLSALHKIGMVCGLVFLAASIGLEYAIRYRLGMFSAANLLVLVMLLFTAISQFGITPRMRQLSASGDSFQAREEFTRLHGWSERLEGGVMFLGLGVLVLTTRRLGR